MDTSSLLGYTVNHSYYGPGVVVNINDKLLQVRFGTGELKKFQFPQAFGTYLNVDDEAVMSEILKEKQIRKQEEDRKRAEAEEKVRLRARQEAEERLTAISVTRPNKKKSGTRSASKAVSSMKEEPRVYDGRIIGPETSFATHAETLNSCFGYHYVHYQQAGKDLENGYMVWFPRIAKKSGGQYLSSDSYWGWVNILSDSRDTITQMDNPDYPYTGGGADIRNRLIFARFERENCYRFIGVFGRGERLENGSRYTRLGTKFDTKAMKIIE